MKGRVVFLLVLLIVGMALGALIADRGFVETVRLLSGSSTKPDTDDEQEYPELPMAPLIPAIPQELTRALPPSLSITVRDASFDHRRVLLRVPYLQVVGSAGEGVHLSLLHLRGARIVSRQTGIVIPIDPFMELSESRIEIDRLRIEDTRLERRQLTGETLFFFEDIDLDARSIAIGGTAPEGLRIVHADLVGEFEGTPVDIRQLTANAVRGRNLLTGVADVQLAQSRAHLDGSLTRADAYQANVTVETSNYGELHAFVDNAPRAGSGAIEARFEGRGDDGMIALQRADMQLNQSSVSARGVLRTGDGGSVQNVVVDIGALHSADLKQAYDVELPGGGLIRGRVTGDGPLAAGVRVDGTLHRLTERDSTLVRLSGLVRDSAGMRIDATARAEPVRVADTVLVVALRGQGTLDSLALKGDITLATRSLVANGHSNDDPDAVRDIRATVDALMTRSNDVRTLRGNANVSATVTDHSTGEPVRLHGTIDGTATLSSGGAIAAEVRADSLPLRVLPVPDAVHHVDGVATGSGRIGGTIDEPVWSGVVNVSGGGLRVRRAETHLTGLHGTIRVDNDVVSTEGLRGELGEGTLELAGSARVRGDARPVDATLRIDRGLILNNDSLRAVASSDLRINGDLTAPRVRGRVTVHNGRFDEDMLKESEPLDLDDPPYSSLARQVPWIRQSRLLPRDASRVTDDSDPSIPLDLDVSLRVERDFRMVDEDSETFGVADIRFTTDEAGVVATGSYRIEGGEYNNFGERFRVAGGFFYFPGEGTTARVSLRGQHDPDAPLGHDLGTGRRALDFFPPLESFGLGSLSVISEELRRLSLLPEDMTELGSLLLYREPVEPVRDWHMDRWWRSEPGTSILGARAETQLFPLLWGYTADETYDLIPLAKAYLRPSTVEVGPAYPGRTMVAGVIGGGLRFAPLALEVRQPIDGTPWPGLQLRYDRGSWRWSAFSEPRYRASTALRGYLYERRQGVRILGRWEW